MSATPLMREALRNLYRAAHDAHPGLLIQRGFQEHDEQDKEAKTAHIRDICAITAGRFYQNAYRRWEQTTGDDLRFSQLRLGLEDRLFIGLTGGGMLETGCAISHSYGMPYIPGSSLKGVVRAHVRASPFGKAHPEVLAELFGADADPRGIHPEGLSGLVVFHDAWWVPGSADKPFVEEIVTSHHTGYYGSDGETEASDFDSPIPNAQVAVQGGFLFVVEGEPAWRELAAEMLRSALSQRGIGAKTRTGYGLFDPEPQRSAGPACPWVDETIAGLVPRPHNNAQEALLGKTLAEQWLRIEDGNLKAAALADIRARWEALGQWESPTGKSARRAKSIYTGADDP